MKRHDLEKGDRVEVAAGALGPAPAHLVGWVPATVLSVAPGGVTLRVRALEYPRTVGADSMMRKQAPPRDPDDKITEMPTSGGPE